MEYYAGIDVSLKDSSVCVVDATGKLVREVKMASEPQALVRFFDELGLSVSRTIIRAHGGRLWAENRASGSAMFHIAIPQWDGSSA